MSAMKQTTVVHRIQLPALVRAHCYFVVRAQYSRLVDFLTNDDMLREERQKAHETNRATTKRKDTLFRRAGRMRPVLKKSANARQDSSALRSGACQASTRVGSIFTWLSAVAPFTVLAAAVWFVCINPDCALRSPRLASRFLQGTRTTSDLVHPRHVPSVVGRPSSLRESWELGAIRERIRLCDGDRLVLEQGLLDAGDVLGIERPLTLVSASSAQLLHFLGKPENPNHMRTPYVT